MAYTKIRQDVPGTLEELVQGKSVPGARTPTSKNQQLGYATGLTPIHGSPGIDVGSGSPLDLLAQEAFKREERLLMALATPGTSKEHIAELKKQRDELYGAYCGNLKTPLAAPGAKAPSTDETPVSIIGLRLADLSPQQQADLLEALSPDEQERYGKTPKYWRKPPTVKNLAGYMRASMMVIEVVKNQNGNVTGKEYRKLWQEVRDGLSVIRAALHLPTPPPPTRHPRTDCLTLAEWLERQSQTGANPADKTEAANRPLEVVVASEEPKPATPMNPGNPKIRPCAEKAWNQYQWAISENSVWRDKPDRAVYEYLREKCEEEDELPKSFATFSKYLREARTYYDQRKHNPRKNRSTGKSVIRAEQK